MAVSPAAAAVVGLVAAGTTQAGASLSLVVTVDDAFGNIATGYAVTLHFTTSDTQAAPLLPDYIFMGSDAGQHTFSVVLKTAGKQSITATDTVKAGLTGAQGGIVVTPAAARSLLLTGYPATASAGVAQGFVVSDLGAFNNVVATFADTVHFTSSDAKALLPTDYTFTAADAGVHVFAATLPTSGIHQVRATDTQHASITGVTPLVTVAPAAAKRLVISGYPTTVSANTANNFTVTL
jgi:hypothetical protein